MYCLWLDKGKNSGHKTDNTYYIARNSNILRNDLKLTKINRKDTRNFKIEPFYKLPFIIEAHVFPNFLD